MGCYYKEVHKTHMTIQSMSPKPPGMVVALQLRSVTAAMTASIAATVVVADP